MKIIIALAIILGNSLVLKAADRYVSLSGTNDFANQFTTWAGAATDIQWAVNFALAGETVWVSNGTYYLTNQVNIASGITLKSFSGSYADTVINGNNFDGKPVTNRCINMTHAGAVVEGFTITNGFPGNNNQSGGGVFMTAGTLRNCLVTGNQVTNNGTGGGIYATGASSLITNCDIIGNVMSGQGGGAYLQLQAQLWNCRIIFNHTSLTNGACAGGGIFVNNSTGVVCNSIIISNRLTGKTSGDYGGGVRLDRRGILRNCLIMGNYAWLGGGVCAPSDSASSVNYIENCTIVSNYATSSCGGIGAPYYGGNTNKKVQVNNTICYSNRVGEVGWSQLGEAVFSNCCVPYGAVLPGSGNLTNRNPAFVNFTGSDFRLSKESPCINAGFTQPWMFSGATDLDGFSRLDRISGRVDMGCYEDHPRGLMFKMR